MKADLFISVTKKIKEEYNNKINVFTKSILNISIMSIPIILLFAFVSAAIFIDNFFSLIFVPFVFISLIYSIFVFVYFKDINSFSKHLIHKINFKKRLTPEEKSINIKSIVFEEDGFQNGLIDYYISFLEQELSQDDFKKALEFILNQKDFSEINAIKIMDYLMFNKYKDQNIIEVIYDKDKNEVLYQLSHENTEYKKILENWFQIKMNSEKFILEQSTLDHIIKYKDFEKLLSSFDIVNKTIGNFSVKVLIKLIFETNINKIQADELKLYNFLNNLELERKIKIKKIIIEHALYLKDENNIYDYKEDFFNLASSLNIKDKDLLYLMNQKIAEKEKVEEKNLKIINI